MTVTPTYSDMTAEDDMDIVDDPPRVSKFNWKTHGSKAYWGHIIESFTKTHHLNIHISAINDAEHPRQVSVLTANDALYHEAMSTLGKEGLFFQQVEGRLNDVARSVLNENNPLQWAEGEYSIEEEYTLVFGESNEAINTFIQNATGDVDDDDQAIQTLADMLGWPDCCIQSFRDDMDHGTRDHMYRAACETESAVTLDDDQTHVHVTDPSPLLNTVWNHVGVTFTYHQPCSFDCEESISVARKHYEYTLDEVSRKVADGALSWLALPFTWTGYHHLTNIRSAYAIGSYTTDTHWLKKKVVWGASHADVPDGETIHNTTDEELLDPDVPDFT